MKLYYSPSEDWITFLEGPESKRLKTTLKALSLERLQRYPPPKVNGLPIGNELRILSRFLTNKSSQLDASAFSGSYRKFCSPEEMTLYRAFRENVPLENWKDIIGPENVDIWIKGKLLREDGPDRLVCRFSIVVVDGVTYLVDPLNDHGRKHHETIAVEADPSVDNEEAMSPYKPFHHTYIGLDSLRQIEIMSRDGDWSGERYLDCGCGAGALLLYFARNFKEAVGIDLNSRAVSLAAFNAELNDMDQISVLEKNALELGSTLGEFDLISWNLPFMFLPEEWKDRAIDGYGGDYGIGLCMDFLERVPELLREGGTACIAAMAPILRDGTNMLEERLRARLPELALDCRIEVVQAAFGADEELARFHESFGIGKFESAYLFLEHGSGKLGRSEPNLGRVLIDNIREKLYRRKYRLEKSQQGNRI